MGRHRASPDQAQSHQLFHKYVPTGLACCVRAFYAKYDREKITWKSDTCPNPVRFGMGVPHRHFSLHGKC